MTERNTTMADLANLFVYHPPKDDTERQTYGVLRDAGRVFAQEVLAFVPEGVEREEAIKHIRAAVMWANSGVACAPRPSEHPQPLVEVLAVEEFPPSYCDRCREFARDPQFGLVSWMGAFVAHLGRSHGWTSEEHWRQHGIDTFLRASGVRD